MLSQVKNFADERVDLRLLSNHGLVEFVEQVFGKTGFDFEFGEPLGRFFFKAWHSENS